MLAGEWKGSSKLQDTENGIADESASLLSVIPVLGGKFVRLDYTWAYKEKPQEGSMLVGYDPKSGEVTAHWIDSFHTGPKAMACTGRSEAERVLSVRGSYAAPPGPDWGWRTVITASTDAIEIAMYNVWPEGNEELAVEMNYQRA